MYLIYGHDQCSWCRKAKELALKAAVDFEYINIKEDDEAYDFIVNTGAHQTIPQVYFQSDDYLTHIGGYEAFKAELDAGKL